MVRSQDRLTCITSESGLLDQRRSACQQDYKRIIGFIPADCHHASNHYSLSAAFHYSLNRSVPPQTHTINCNTTIFNDVHTRWLLGRWCEKFVVPCAQGATGNQAVLQNQSYISATAFRNSSTVGAM